MSQPIENYTEQILKGNMVWLSKAITLAESSLPQHAELSQQIIEQLLPHTGNSIRIGITGVPGVGKSTFIDTFGTYLCEAGKKVAVLAIDPSSNISKGSILGDKTRMENLVNNANAYIRPTASGNTLGGTAKATREAILLCEAAGYNIIIVETVGVGQSETAVKNITDFFLLLMLAGAGDELQGMKRGIMEMADMVLINKADGDNIEKAKQAAQQYKQALHLFPPHENGWATPVNICSAINNSGIDNAWKIISKYQQEQKVFIEYNRIQQQLMAFREYLQKSMLQFIFSSEKIKEQIAIAEKNITQQKSFSHKEAQQILSIVYNKL